jgi:hypothetical protein
VGHGRAHGINVTQATKGFFRGQKKAPSLGLGQARQVPGSGVSGHALEHFDADFACCNFTQGSHAGLVLAFNAGRVALAQHAGTVGGCQNQLKAVRDLFQAIFNSDAGHDVFLENF